MMAEEAGRGGRPSLMWRLWTRLHGEEHPVPEAEVVAARARLAALEAAVQHLRTLEDVEEQREDRR